MHTFDQLEALVSTHLETLHSIENNRARQYRRFRVNATMKRRRTLSCRTFLIAISSTGCGGAAASGVGGKGESSFLTEDEASETGPGWTEARGRRKRHGRTTEGAISCLFDGSLNERARSKAKVTILRPPSEVAQRPGCCLEQGKRRWRASEGTRASASSPPLPPPSLHVTFLMTATEKKGRN